MLLSNGENHMDEKMMRKINRQLRAIKVMLGFFSLLIIAMLLILGFIAWKVVTFTQDVNNKITNIEHTTQQKLDIKGELCDGASSNTITDQFCN
jgi:predicted PurR-regulated permease PerM